MAATFAVTLAGAVTFAIAGPDDTPATGHTLPAPAPTLPPLRIPVQGIGARQIRDTFHDLRGSGSRTHEAIDIMAARGTPVVAAAPGRVVKLFHSVPGGLTVYQFDPGERFAYYYAHLDSYAPGLAEQQELKAGDPIGFVGSTGNASPDAPHLHFAVFVLGPEKQWWKGTAVDPFEALTAAGTPDAPDLP